MGRCTTEEREKHSVSANVFSAVNSSIPTLFVQVSRGWAVVNHLLASTVRPFRD